MPLKYLENKSVAITGCCGTIGRELVRQLLDIYQVKRLVGLDNNESELFFTEQQFNHSGRTQFFLTDIRDKEKLVRVLQGVDVLFHTAAYKHVILCEKSPFEATQTNILGVKNIITAAEANGLERVIFTSSDKAVNPTNVMGTSKLMGERLFTAAAMTYANPPILASTRFGNVLGSRGSVIPIFKRQIKNGGPITLTHPDMTRFIMSVEEAVQLVIDSSVLACGGEVFVTKMPVVRIQDLAEVMIRELAPRYGRDPGSIEIREIGTKPGEKMYEELMSLEETRRTMELERYFVVLPAFRREFRTVEYSYPGVLSESVDIEYNSSHERCMTQEELLEFLRNNGLLEDN